jgi:hypothetical protein
MATVVTALRAVFRSENAQTKEHLPKAGGYS